MSRIVFLAGASEARARTGKSERCWILMTIFQNLQLKPQAWLVLFPATDRVFFAVKSTLDAGREGNGQGGGEESYAGQVELVKKVARLFAVCFEVFMPALDTIVLETACAMGRLLLQGSPHLAIHFSLSLFDPCRDAALPAVRWASIQMGLPCFA